MLQDRVTEGFERLFAVVSPIVFNVDRLDVQSVERFHCVIVAPSSGRSRGSMMTLFVAEICVAASCMSRRDNGGRNRDPAVDVVMAKNLSTGSSVHAMVIACGHVRRFLLPTDT